ncbi:MULTISPECIES: hypothetical protein [unclassified Xanthobacter]|uniref:hypothetical protein n=1 Tax=unclassified Xanthobacter TaxID=2623496 RepID=UPI001EDEB3BA|nr:MULTISPECIES: hypothetical protein [unclassified Xanthobacter]
MRPMRHAPAILSLPLSLALAASAWADSGDSTSRSLNADGSTSMRYERQLADLGAQVGMSLSTEASSAVPGLVPGTQAVSGAAFAKVALPELPSWLMWQKGSVNVAVSPSDEESKLGTTLSRSWTLYEGLKAELSDSYEIARSTSGGGWQTDKAFRIKMIDTGTTFSFGASASDSTPQLLPSVSAQQKVFGAVNVTTTLADTGSELNKSITAGFSHRW